jgi:hypothetical protein
MMPLILVALLLYSAAPASVFNPGLAAPQAPAWASGSTAVVTLVITVGRTGFNNTSGPFNVTVPQGTEVRITFVYADGDLSFDNPHEITIDGYAITTRPVSKANPTVTVDFVAGQQGNFKFYCSVPCLGMENLQGGRLEVQPPNSPIFTKTTLTVTHIEVHSPSTLHIVAKVADEQGRPVVGVLVDFYISTLFGMMNVGTNVTSADGAASLLYPLPSAPEAYVEAAFRGSGNYEPSNATDSFVPSQLAPAYDSSPYVSGQSPTVDTRLVGTAPLAAIFMVGTVIIVVLSVWSVYLYVIRQVVGIKRSSAKAEKKGGTGD